MHRYMITMSFYSAFCGLNLAVIHAQGKWLHHSQCDLELTDGEWDLLMAEFGLVK